MSTIESVSWFLEAPCGRLHATSFRPAAQRACAAVLFFPPFAEEMNRARRMVAVQARAAAHHGFEVLVLDPYGTGDSDGDFADATWERWYESMAAGWRWLEGRYGRVIAWSLRAGAFLAGEVATAVTSGVARHVLWQPPGSGATVLDQFLRLRVAADIVGSVGTRETVAGLREQLAGGNVLEIAGYPLSPAIATALAARSLPAVLGQRSGHIRILEVAGAGPARNSPAVGALCDKLRQAGHVVAANAVVGPSFWSTVETVVALELVAPTIAAFEELAAG